MTLLTTPPDEPVRLVRPAELDEIESWLIPKLQESWPLATTQGLHSWMQQALHDRASLFVRADRVVGLFQATTSVLDHRPLVTERFVRQKAVVKKEAVLLYAHAIYWARTIKARAMVLNCDNNIDIQRVITELGLEPTVGPALHLPL